MFASIQYATRHPPIQAALRISVRNCFSTYFDVFCIGGKGHSFFMSKGIVLTLPIFIGDDRLSVFLRYETSDWQGSN
jgi:hypothetical protein